MNAPLVRVEGLTKVFAPRRTVAMRIAGRTPPALTAVDDVSFTIRKGTTYALVGESGSGKSTIARMVAGLLEPTRGTVRIGDAAVTGAGQAAADAAGRRRLQMIFQDPYSSLNPRWKVNAIIGEPLMGPGERKGRAETLGAVGTLLERVGLHPDDGVRYPHEFSGGQRQRIAIARAIATRADFIICDEPTSALDVSVQAQILNLMRELQDELGLTYFFISHNLAVVRFMADDIGVLSRGRLVEDGPAAAIFEAPRHEYTRRLIAAVPTVDAVEERVGAPGQAVSGEAP
ncbi:ABC transporter ATP-binding protein [Acuticoccus sediminis]|uniref:ABC transporter ATP-binding protein n=1 Tax=Acuticoccus sediminis TaxID=2184697 RepID=A0A8B2NKG1_9HYPH|nr:ATP-binding cassette domain-containing protein [Acuticoccus sediminis]RAI00105.1 ABC transporter ATP-binding protein [Acuticoccus sediminis]